MKQGKQTSFIQAARKLDRSFSDQTAAEKETTQGNSKGSAFVRAADRLDRSRAVQVTADSGQSKAKEKDEIRQEIKAFTRASMLLNKRRRR